MKRARVLLALLATVLLVTLASPVTAAPPVDSPAKGPPEYDKIVFIHYGNDNHGAKPPGTPGGGNGGGNGGGKGDKNGELYSYSKVHWADSDIPISYWINLTNNPVANTYDAIEASFQIWEDDPESYIDFKLEGTTTVVPGLNVSSPDYNNVVGWADLSEDYPNAIGITIIWSLRGKKLIVDVDTVLNTNSFFAWTVAGTVIDPDTELLPDTDGYDVDVQNIMTHEAGHWLVLNDLYEDIYLEQTMYGVSSDRELKRRSLEDDGDILGLRKIYPGATK